MSRKVINRDELASSQRGRKKINDNFLELYHQQELTNQDLASISNHHMELGVIKEVSLCLMLPIL